VGSGPVSAEVAPRAPGTGSAPAAPPEARESRVLTLVGGQERWLDEPAAVAAGYTIVDFSDDWTPYIFAPQNGPDGAPLENRYRRIFIASPTISSTRTASRCPRARRTTSSCTASSRRCRSCAARFLADEQHPCHDEESADALDAVETVTYVPPSEIAKEQRRIAHIKDELEKARREANVGTLEELAAKQPALAPR